MNYIRFNGDSPTWREPTGLIFLLPHVNIFLQVTVIRSQSETIEDDQTQGAFHLSELTGQTIPVIIRISLLIKTIQPDR